MCIYQKQHIKNNDDDQLNFMWRSTFQMGSHLLTIARGILISNWCYPIQQRSADYYQIHTIRIISVHQSNADQEQKECKISKS